jgi:RNA polymerase sigma factor (sigma-70 family)
MEEKSDKQLVMQARLGDKEAFCRLVERYQTMAQRIARRFVPDDGSALELMQEALLQAYLSLPKLQNPDRFRAWLYGIVLNVCRGYIQDRKMDLYSLEALSGESPLNPAAEPGDSPGKLAEECEVHQIVLQTVRGLSPADQDIILGFYFEQLSLKEIGQRHGLELNAVKVRLHRARQRLKARLLEQHPETFQAGKRRGKMIQVTIADVVKREYKDAKGASQPINYVVMLQDEAGRRALPIWVGAFEGQSIARALGNVSEIRPLTFNFLAEILKAIDARIEQVQIAALKNDIFYAVVKIRQGKTTREIDARPSDGMALALLTGSPIFVADDVLATAGMDIPPADGAPRRRGVATILMELDEFRNKYAIPPGRVISPEKMDQEKKALITDVFGA